MLEHTLISTNVTHSVFVFLTLFIFICVMVRHFLSIWFILKFHRYWDADGSHVQPVLGEIPPHKAGPNIHHCHTLLLKNVNQKYIYKCIYFNIDVRFLSLLEVRKINHLSSHLKPFISKLCSERFSAEKMEAETTTVTITVTVLCGGRQPGHKSQSHRLGINPSAHWWWTVWTDSYILSYLGKCS